MGAITDTAKTTYAAGPVSDQYEPDKADIIRLFSLIDGSLSSLVNGAVIGGAIVYSTRAELYSDLTYPAGRLGVVYNDPTAAYNGVYVKSGASGSGSWSLTSLGLPATFAADLAAVIDEVTVARGDKASLSGRLASGHGDWRERYPRLHTW